MKTWELIPKAERPDAQVLLILPNGESEYIDGFRYQEFRRVVVEGGRPLLIPDGPPHTRYRYLPRQRGTYAWQHRTPPGGILEHGAFVADPAPATPAGRPLPPALDPVVMVLPSEEQAAAHPDAVERVLEAAAREERCVRIPLDDAEGAVALSDGEPDLARCWLLDEALRAAEGCGVGIILRLPAPAGAASEQLYAALHLTICRYSAMPAVIAWETAASGETAEAAARFLHAFDPYRPVILAHL